MKELWEVCRKLSNPERLDLLRRAYVRRDSGIGVNEGAEESKLGQPTVSEYFKQLMELGLLRRERGGRLVGYYPDWSTATEAIAVIAEMLYERFAAGSNDTGFSNAFEVFGNAFRLRVIRYVAKYGSCSKESLAGVFNKPIRLLTRDLEPAVKGGVLALDPDETGGVYRYIPPSDSIAWRVVELQG